MRGRSTVAADDLCVSLGATIHIHSSDGPVRLIGHPADADAHDVITAYAIAIRHPAPDGHATTHRAPDGTADATPDPTSDTAPNAATEPAGHAWIPHGRGDRPDVRHGRAHRRRAGDHRLAGGP